MGTDRRFLYSQILSGKVVNWIRKEKIGGLCMCLHPPAPLIMLRSPRLQWQKQATIINKGLQQSPLPVIKKLTKLSEYAFGWGLSG